VATALGDEKNGKLLDETLAGLLARHGFTGRIEEQLEARLGRRVNPELAEIGRNLFFDPIMALRGDNSCAGCHAPQFGFADSQSIAIGIRNNNVVGHGRTGPRNQRRSPTLLNSAFFPALMWNARFFAPTSDPFDNTLGFVFPLPEGVTRFPPGDDRFQTLLAAQGHLPQTELVEMTGFAGVTGAEDIDESFYPFDDGVGIAVPGPDASGFRNEPIRSRVLVELNDSAYGGLFGRVFPSVRRGEPIDFAMVGAAIAEFEFTLTFADAPLDRFARGQRSAMTAAEKRGAVLFFGQANCVACHRASGLANEMFSDFANHRLGVPQLAPRFGLNSGNVHFDGPHADEDFGAEQISGRKSDRYKFRTSPLRNVALAPTFFHNGCFTRLEDAIAHHLDPVASAKGYDPNVAGVALDLHLSQTPVGKVLQDLDPLLELPPRLTAGEFRDLVQFVRTGLLDERATPEQLLLMVPRKLPSGLPLHDFERGD
ncbi:MAG TPA: cytochrome c peroxidase, partial [Pirellulaceae bacterium]|nr:cytochrome c peroxidase [Pirellulaceae bacterium]